MATTKASILAIMDEVSKQTSAAAVQQVCMPGSLLVVEACLCHPGLKESTHQQHKI
jgi:hypothetical protein